MDIKFRRGTRRIVRLAFAAVSLFGLISRVAAQNVAGKPRDLIAAPTLDESKAGEEERWAVVIGISKYQAPGHNLNYSADDARAFAGTLEQHCGFARDHIKLLLNEQATAQAIRAALGTWLAKAAGRQDLVVIYYSGHGAPDHDDNVSEDGIRKYLVSYDADPNDLFSTAVPMDDLSAALLRVRSERAIVLLDCCYSGAAAPAGQAGAVRTFAPHGVQYAEKIKSGFIDTLARSGRGRAVITGCDPSERSWEYNDLKHGIFTHYLIEGLEGGATDPQQGYVNVNGLYDYVFRKLHDGDKKRAAQTPVMSTTVAGELIVAGKGVHAKPGSGKGTLQILTSPLGADILIDRNPPVKSPCVVSLPSGLHQISIVKQKYLLQHEEVFVAPDRLTLQSFLLKAQETRGDLVIRAQAGALIKVDGQERGRVGESGLLALFDLPETTYSVRVETAGFLPKEKTVSVSAGGATVEDFLQEKELAGKREPEARDIPAGLARKNRRLVWEKDGAEMAFVSEGAFWFGLDDSYDAGPRQEVVLPAYWIDRCEVTNAQFARFVAEMNYRVKGGWHPPAAGQEKRPAVNVTLADAKAYAAWAGKSLPSEAQWEKAARGPDGRLYPYGNDFDKRYQNTRSMNIKEIIDVGSLEKGASPYGAYDMLGNAAEWCDTLYRAYPGFPKALPNFDKGFCVVRGGSFRDPAVQSDLSVAMRSYLRPNLGQEDVGFRCVVSAP